MICPSCSDDSAANENTVLHIAEERDDDSLANTTHTTEDLFTIIHRYEYAYTFAVHFRCMSIMVIIDNYVTVDVFPQKAVVKVKKYNSLICFDSTNLS